MRRATLLLMASFLAAILVTSAFAADPAPVPTVIEGAIASIAPPGGNVGRITVHVSSPTPATSARFVTIFVGEKTRIYKDGLPVKLPALAVGDTVRALVIRTADGVMLAQTIYAKTPQLKSAKGVIVEKALWNGIGTFRLRVADSTVTLWFSVSSATKITVDGIVATYAQLASGQMAEVSYVQPPPQMTTVILPIPASVVAARNPAPLLWARGTIVEKSLWNGKQTFKLRLATGTQTIWFSVDATTRITVDGEIAPYERLANGQTAEVGYVQPPPLVPAVIVPTPASVVAAKNAAPPPTIRIVGRLVSVNLATGVIGVRIPPKNLVLNIRVTDETLVKKFGPARLADLTPASATYPGDSVEVLATPVMATVVGAMPVAVSIAVSPETQAGTIAGVDIYGKTFRLIPVLYGTVVPTAMLFKVMPETVILKNGVPVGLGDLKIRDFANVRYFQFGLEKRAYVVEARSPVVVGPIR